MKLANFASLDSPYPGHGLVAVGGGDRAVWHEFASDQERLAREAAAIRVRVGAPPHPQGPLRRYWALGASPTHYRALDAIREQKIVRWTTKGKQARTWDRILIWKHGGPDGRRGVVGFGEVICDPAPSADPEGPYWLVPHTIHKPRCAIRLVHFCRTCRCGLMTTGPSSRRSRSTSARRRSRSIAPASTAASTVMIRPRRLMACLWSPLAV